MLARKPLSHWKSIHWLRSSRHRCESSLPSQTAATLFEPPLLTCTYLSRGSSASHQGYYHTRLQVSQAVSSQHSNHRAGPQQRTWCRSCLPSLQLWRHLGHHAILSQSVEAHLQLNTRAIWLAAARFSQEIRSHSSHLRLFTTRTWPKLATARANLRLDFHFPRSRAGCPYNRQQLEI